MRDSTAYFGLDAVSTGHHGTGFNISETSLDVLREIQQLRDAPVLLYCRSIFIHNIYCASAVPGVLRKTQSMIHLHEKKNTHTHLTAAAMLHRTSPFVLINAKQSNQNRHLRSHTTRHNREHTAKYDGV